MNHETARQFAIASATLELAQPDIPDHVHGTFGGYNNHGCRGPLCRMAVAERRGSPRRPSWGPDLLVWEATRDMLHSILEERAQEHADRAAS